MATLPEAGKTRDQLGDLAHVSGRTLDKVKLIEEKAGPEVKAKPFCGPSSATPSPVSPR